MILYFLRNFFIISCFILCSDNLIASSQMFNSLPLENRVKIVSYLGKEDFMNAIHSCKSLYQTARYVAENKRFRIKSKTSHLKPLHIKSFFQKVEIWDKKHIKTSDWQYFLINSILKELVVRKSNFNNEVLKFLIDNKNLSTSLIRLELEAIKINDKSDNFFKSLLIELPQLENFIIRFTPLTLNMSKLILEGLNNHKHLKNLTIIACKMNDEKFLYLSKCLEYNKTIETLYLTSNTISDNEVKHLENFLLKNETLINLDISYNNISSIGLTKLIYNFTDHKNIRYFTAIKNNISYTEDLKNALLSSRLKNPNLRIRF